MSNDYFEKMRRLRSAEKIRLLAMSESEAQRTLSIADRYQRMRYLREDEAAGWLEDVRRHLPAEDPSKPFKGVSNSSVVVYRRD